GQTQLIGFDAEEVADALEIVRRGPALPAEVFVELAAIDRQLAAHLGDGAVVAAEQLEIGAQVVGHGVVPGDASDAILASGRVSSPRPAQLNARLRCRTICRSPLRDPFPRTRETPRHARYSQRPHLEQAADRVAGRPGPVLHDPLRLR